MTTGQKIAMVLFLVGWIVASFSLLSMIDDVRRRLRALESKMFASGNEGTIHAPSVATGGIRYQHTAQVPEEVPAHVHEWESIPLDTVGTSRIGIEFAMLGQTCKCGATRIYQGPSHGWITMKEGTRK
jgi:hypothetical protein